MPRRRTIVKGQRSLFVGRGRLVPRRQWSSSKAVQRTGAYRGKPASKPLGRRRGFF
jgi:hypothetical protein